MIAGFDRPDAGRVLLDREDVHAMPRARLERRVAWLGAVIPKRGRAKRPVPPLIVGDDPEAPLAVELERVPIMPFAAQAELARLDQRLVPLLATIRFLCDQGAVVVIGTTHRLLVKAADLVVELPPQPGRVVRL